jgi:serine kinase of HPr protein (carbohydrate metabolism regulator)
VSETETIHATSVAIGDRGVLILGPSGAGKSDLALRLIDRGAVLVSDDYTQLTRSDGALVATAPARIAGQMEVRGIGIVDVATRPSCTVHLAVELDSTIERMPEAAGRSFLGAAVPLVRLDPAEPSAPIKVELALRLLAPA